MFEFDKQGDDWLLIFSKDNSVTQVNLGPISSRSISLFNTQLTSSKDIPTLKLNSCNITYINELVSFSIDNSLYQFNISKNELITKFSKVISKNKSFTEIITPLLPTLITIFNKSTEKKEEDKENVINNDVSILIKNLLSNCNLS